MSGRLCLPGTTEESLGCTSKAADCRRGQDMLYWGQARRPGEPGEGIRGEDDEHLVPIGAGTTAHAAGAAVALQRGAGRARDLDQARRSDRPGHRRQQDPQARVTGGRRPGAGGPGAADRRRRPVQPLPSDGSRRRPRRAGVRAGAARQSPAPGPLDRQPAAGRPAGGAPTLERRRAPSGRSESGGRGRAGGRAPALRHPLRRLQ